MIRPDVTIARLLLIAAAFIGPATEAGAQNGQAARKTKQQGYDATRATSPSARIDNRLRTRIDTRLDTRLDDTDTKVRGGLQSYTSAADAIQTPEAKSSSQR